MTDEQIESLLRESWTAGMPAGMRDRVLARARTEAAAERGLSRRRRRRLLLTALSLAWIITVARVDAGRVGRLEALSQGGAGRPTPVAVPGAPGRHADGDTWLAFAGSSAVELPRGL